mmetsp:Transcript_79004/g.218677  ORF Transcript_79004/g.218677 Transcript_79004/m.218677 type:complete len:254 (+) Transcript_79004:1000-1761(+)
MRMSSNLSKSSSAPGAAAASKPVPCCAPPTREAAARFSASTQALQLSRSTTLAAVMASRRRLARFSARVRIKHVDPARKNLSITCNRTEKVSFEFSSHCGLTAGLKVLGTAACPWLSTDSTRATSFRIKFSLMRACLCLRASSRFWISAGVNRSSPRAVSLLSSFSRSCFAISRKSISKRSSRACICSSSASSSPVSSSVARRILSCAASRWSLMKDTRSLSGNLPAVWFSTKLVACLSMREVGTFTPSIVRS